MTDPMPGFSTLAIHALPSRTRDRRARKRRSTRPPRSSSKMPITRRPFSGLQQFGNIYTRIMNPHPGGAGREGRGARRRHGSACGRLRPCGQMLVFHTIMQPAAISLLQSGFMRLHQPFGHAFKNFGWEVRWADPADRQALPRRWMRNPRRLHRKPANPGGTFVDIAAIAEVAPGPRPAADR